MANRLVSYADLTAFLETDTIETQPEGRPLAMLLDAMTGIFEDHLNRTLSAGTYTETVFTSGRGIPLKALPINSVVSLTVCGQELGTTDYRIAMAGVRLLTLISDLDEPVTVTYIGGYAVNGSGILQVPAAIRQAALYQIAHEWKQKDKPGATLIESAAGKLTLPGLNLLDYVKKLLAPYQHPALLG